ncbi:MAG: type II toxin-antitoxin system VapC family toxin [Candidatus Sulfopaludibacter sp.]|nr:type II toxin-antitoxin system VapC family toxin [Candidatus Sulfopaludibacter sp.]
MQVPDINILVYAYDADAPNHKGARAWWEDTLSGTHAVGMPWLVVLGFIRIMTHRRILRKPMTVTDSVKAVRTWLAHPDVQIVTPGERHAEILFDLLNHLGTAGNLTTDAHLAALAIEYDAELVSADADFSRFAGLRWFNPVK